MSQPQHIVQAPRIGFLVVGRQRPGFDPAWGQQIQAQALAALEKAGMAIVRPEAPATDEASMTRAIAEFRAAGCEGLLVLQPTMGDGRLLPTLMRCWGDPLVIWATTERQDSDRVSACTLVGSHAFASFLAQQKHPFEIVNGHPAEADTMRQVDLAVRLTVTRSRLRRAYVGLIGAHAPGFLNMQVDQEMLRSAVGVSLKHLSVQELIDTATAIDAGQVKKDRQQIDALGLRRDDEIPGIALEHTSRYLLAIQQLFADHQFNALAVRCWPELPNVVGTWPYLAFARLADMGYGIAMEGDVDGAATLLLGQLMGYGTGYLSDWLEHDARAITLWHQGEAPLSICEKGAALGLHFNNNKPVVVNATLAADRPITLCRLWHCDGRYRLMAADARTESPSRPLKGTCGRAVLSDGRDVREWFDHLCHAGMPHHVALFQGHRTAELKRLARQLKIDFE